MGLATDKIELIKWLSNLNNTETISFLKIIKSSSESNTDWWDELTEKQKLSIERGLLDIEEGRVTPHAEVKKKYEL